MTGTFQQDFRYSALDTDTLQKSFEVETNWHVITGAPSCGKTTLIDLLAARGFQTLPETAHWYIEGELAAGRALDEIFGDRLSLQIALIDQQIEAEKRLRAEQVVFLDRALPDSITFNRFVGRDPNEFLRDCFYHRYASVFMLDPLPYHQDGIRDIDAPNVAFLDEWIPRDYQALGYEVIRVPVLSPRERVEYILKRISAYPG